MKKFSIKCPACGQLSEYSSKNDFRPFCSSRCQVLDRSMWADEAYRIPEASPAEWE